MQITSILCIMSWSVNSQKYVSTNINGTCTVAMINQTAVTQTHLLCNNAVGVYCVHYVLIDAYNQKRGSTTRSSTIFKIKARHCNVPSISHLHNLVYAIHLNIILLCSSGLSKRIFCHKFFDHNFYIKVELSPCLLNYSLLHEDLWGSVGIAHPSLTSALNGGEWSASRRGRFTPGVRASSTHWIGGWVGPRGGLDAVE
jgi:hypothetical protein